MTANRMMMMSATGLDGHASHAGPLRKKPGAHEEHRYVGGSEMYAMLQTLSVRHDSAGTQATTQTGRRRPGTRAAPGHSASVSLRL